MTALRHHRRGKDVLTSHSRMVRTVGRMGITETEKRPGDVIWNSWEQRFEVVR